MNKKTVITLLLTLFSIAVQATQRFYNLTAEDVRIDSLLPVFSCTIPLNGNYADSTYSVSLRYPEFLEMQKSDRERCRAMGFTSFPSQPQIHQQVVVDRKRASLEVLFTPIVERDGRWMKLVSFMLEVEARATAAAKQAPRGLQDLQTAYGSKAKVAVDSHGYAQHSVLASGRWAKISVPENGVYQLTDELIRKAGLTNLSKVHVYGYGGNLQNEILRRSELQATDDLQEVMICETGGKRLFYGRGPVSWSTPSALTRTRNPYSNVGCYFITQNDSTTAVTDSATFVSTFYPAANDFHTLHEVDNYAWFEGGRNLYENDPIANGSQKDYTLTMPDATSDGKIAVRISAGKATTATILLNDSTVGTLNITLPSSYDHGGMATGNYNVKAGAQQKVTVKVTEGGPVRLDYIDLYTKRPKAAPQLSKVTAQPDYVYNIMNQDHHADSNVDMVIVIPTSQKLLAQAERLKAFHEEHDTLTVRIVPADELINEFASGTPDANAYRRYLKMMYDRAGNDESLMPRYLLLFGDCAWDNRMNTSAWANYSPDDFLLCNESENSFSSTDCYVNDGFFCSLDEGEGGSPATSDKHDIAVGRFPVRDADEAKIMVDKTIAYVENANAGSWQNTIMFMGDDGNNNLHMNDADEAARMVETLNPGLLVKRVMWDAYTEVASSTGNTYPDASALIRQQQAVGALIMDYCGHGSQTQISHEAVLRLNDFKGFSNKNLPLWITASCDIAPFDSQTENIGEQAVLNPNGGAVAFYGTTRTVYTDRNKRINKAFLRALFTKEGRHLTLGEAQRHAKNSLIEGGSDGFDQTVNKLQYSLLGDPALRLNIPTMKAVIDSINGKAVDGGEEIQLKALSVATVKGHIEQDGRRLTDYDGMMTATVRDTKELITCKQNATAEADNPFTYYDRTKTLFNGTDSVRGGNFSFRFAVTKDINYANEDGLINIYAVDNAHKRMANGSCNSFVVGGTATADNDNIGPNVFCYLNSPSFVNGGNVNSTPYFVAEISDEDGINTTGTGIGHDLELIIDNDMARTYVLNDNFQYDFGTFTSGKTYYSIPTLSAGRHSLKFRAWDVKNNSTTTTLDFNVVEGLQPNFFQVSASKNPAKESTTFIINHDRAGSVLNVEIDIFDIGGRHLWRYNESGTAASGTYTVDWDLCVDGGRRLQTGVYIYRVSISSEGSSQASRAQKIIIMQ